MAKCTKTKVCIIGAGMSGLITCKNFADLGYKSVTVFEQYPQIGGTWVVRDINDGTHTTMNENVLTNLTPSIMAFDGFSYDPKTPLFFNARTQVEYLNDFYNKNKLSKFVRLNHSVIKCDLLNDKSVLVKYSFKDKSFEETFDYLCVCSGHYSKPYIPSFKNRQNFPLRLQHSKDIRNFDQFRDNKTVVVVGSGSSADDVIYYLSKINGIKILNSVRTNKNSYAKDLYRKIDFVVVPQIECLESDGTVRFIDKTECKPDAIICATGFVYSFPFFENIDIYSNNKMRLKNLFNYIIPIEHPQVAFICMLKRIIPSWVSDIQTRWLSKVWNGEIPLLPKKLMLESIQRRDFEKSFVLGTKMFGYMRKLIEEINKCDHSKKVELPASLEKEYIEVNELRLRLRGY